MSIPYVIVFYLAVDYYSIATSTSSSVVAAAVSVVIIVVVAIVVTVTVVIVVCLIRRKKHKQRHDLRYVQCSYLDCNSVNCCLLCLLQCQKRRL